MPAKTDSPNEVDASSTPTRVGLKTASYTLVSIYLLFFMEWLFFVTKPSYLALLTPLQCLLVLAISPIPVVFLAQAALLPVLLLSSRVRWIVYVSFLFPSAVLAALIILLIDNFTYTVFEFGLIVLRGESRVVYGYLYLILLALVMRSVSRHLLSHRPSGRRGHLVARFLLCFSGLCLALAMVTRSSDASYVDLDRDGPREHPDIFLISGDALQADVLNDYRNPLSSSASFGFLGPNTIVLENSFPNACSTSASTSLVLTGRHATSTGMSWGGRYFQGPDVYQHLTSILRGVGYRTLQVAGRSHFVDATFWGLKNAFDLQNHRRVERSIFNILAKASGGRLNHEIRFTDVLLEQVRARVVHAFGGELMEQVHLVTETKPKVSPSQMVAFVDDFLVKNPGPAFVQVHSMLPRPYLKKSSADGARLFEEFVREIVQGARSLGRFESSIFIVWSDHGRSYANDQRLPLLIKLQAHLDIPRPEWNTQALDIAPTLLDAIGLKIPTWMEGRSLLRGTDSLDPLFSIRAGAGPGLEKAQDGLVFGGISDISMVICDRFYNWSLIGGNLDRRRIEGHTSPCDDDLQPSIHEAREILSQHLEERGFRIPDWQ